MQRGIIYITEASIALLLLSMVIIGASIYTTEKPSEKTTELYITQRMHDLMKSRFIEGEFSIQKMESDFRELFPKKSGLVEVNNARVKIGEPGKNGIAVNGVYYSEKMKRTELRVLVYIE